MISQDPASWSINKPCVDSEQTTHTLIILFYSLSKGRNFLTIYKVYSFHDHFTNVKLKPKNLSKNRRL